RWDGQWSIGSISNPNTTEWLPALGAEAAGAAPVEQKHPGGYTQGAGDAHMYVPRPWRAEDLQFFRTAGTGMKNVFVSEYGNGSQIDPIRIVRLMEQNGASEDLDDFRFYRAMSQQFERDWKRWGLETVFASPSEMISAGQRLQTEQRRLALNAIRSNPHLAGYSLTGLSDQAIEGEGLMTTFRELKPGIVDVMTEGFAPVKWCLFADPVHAYRGGTVRVEAVLANEDALRAGTYPVRLRVLGPAGVAYEKRSEITIPDPQSKPEPAMVFPAFDEAVKLAGPAGRYTVEVSIEHGAAATARETILLGDRDLLPAANASVLWLGSSGAGSKFLAGHGAKVSAFPSGRGEQRNVIVVAKDAAESSDAWIRQVRAGSVAILLEPSRLPEGLKGKLDHSAPYFWGRDDIVKPHAIFEGLPSGSLMDLLFYRDLIARDSVTDFDERAENLIPTFALGRPGGQGYWAGSNLLIYSLGEGKVIVSTLRLEENLGRHPAADRLFLNLVTFAAKNLGRSSSSAIQPIRIPMRDGVYLAADLYRAAGGGKAPVLLMRTPYNKATAGGTAVKYAAAGYHVVVQDTRGRYESEGSFYPYNSEGQDGYDTLEWIRRQPWADGRVG
ncbi:MAG TPA: CocE/NonD family hydrolase, partial [Bryobacteraceae bacterium]|nr:CocE/NonD family hydrolase [Bryobacteraceae bacterium]